VSESYQRVEPAPFDAPGQAAASAQGTSAERPPSRWRLPALAALAITALIVVFVLPSWVDPTPPAPAPASPSAASPTQAAAPTSGARDRATTEAASPFADAVEARARSEAQELLAELLEVQEILTERGAETWAPDEMEAIAARALEGDEQYRERAFDAAIERYAGALDAARRLEASLPERFDKAVAETVAAIEAIDQAVAEAALNAAATLEPAAEEVAVLDQRVAALPALAAAVEQAAQAEAASDLERAVEQMNGAAGLDPLHDFVAAELARLRTALRDQRFNEAMSEGYAALDSRNFERAAARFEAARKLLPNSGEVAIAVQELAAARTVARLNALQERGERQLADEDWEAAAASFKEALAVDNSLRFARDGLAVAQPRAVLQAQLTAIQEKPERLVDDAVLREAQQSLAASRALDNLGPKMTAQIAEVERILAVASTPISVQLRSDGETAVTVYKVARLGSFSEQQLSLRPGTYTAVGTRRGYRDVRVVFEVRPGGSGPVTIACTDLI
jgi:hypothetical protein